MKKELLDKIEQIIIYNWIVLKFDDTMIILTVVHFD